MINRRDFLRTAGMFTISSATLPSLAKAGFLFDKAANRPIGIQLYTVFFEMENDPVGTLKKLAAIGYKQVESSFSVKRPNGYYGYSAKEFKKIVADAGLRWVSHHATGVPFVVNGGKPIKGFPIDITKLPKINLRDNYQQLVNDAAEGGLSYLVCAGTSIGNVEEIKKSLAVFQKTGEAAKKASIGFAYHNHATEFDPVPGASEPGLQTAYDFFLSQTDPALVKMELDLAWATKAGKDPVALFKQYPGRFPLWHIKDIKANNQMTEVGNGVVDFKHAFASAKLAGLQSCFVEQDFPANPLESVATSYSNLLKLMA